LNLSPSYLQVFVEALPQALLLADDSLRLRAANPAAEQLSGRSAEELKGLHLADILHSEERMRLGGIMGRGADHYHFNAIALRADNHTWRAEVRLKQVAMDGDRAWLILLSDVSASYEALDALRTSEDRYRGMVEVSPDGVAVLDKGEVSFANGAFEGLLGLGGADEIWGFEFESFVHPDQQPQWRSLMEHLARRGEAPPMDLKLLHKSGETVEVEAVCRTLGRPRERVTLVLARDIKARKRMERRLRESEERYKGLADVAFDGLAVHFDGVILNANRSFEAIFGHPEGSLLGTDIFALFEEDSARLFKRELDSGRVLELSGRQEGGADVHVEASTRACLYHGDPAYVTAVRDITRRRQTEDVVRRQAWYDSLTGLPNRILFLDRLEHALVQARRDGRRVAVLFMDLDRFKIVNDSLGHGVGDQLLQAASGRLQALLRKGDTLARLGGDEFVVLLEDAAVGDDAQTVARKIIESLGQPFPIGSQEIHIGASVGVAYFPDHAGEGERLIKLADMAMYRAKKNGRNQCAVYTEALESGQEKRLDRENELRRGIENQEFVLWYQPQISLADGKVQGAEALLRWQHPVRGLLSPDEFIPLAEESRLIVPLGEWVLNHTCGEAAGWQRMAGINLSVAVNLSAWQLHKRSLIKTVEAALAASGLPASRLELEITETVAMRNPALTLEMLKEFSARGVRLSLDDFGKGYSSLNYLKEFPVHSIKIDQSFVAGLPTEPKDVAIVRAMIALAHSLNLKCLAEGVEKPEQMAFLRDEGCDLAQGYLFSRPVPADEFAILIQRGILLP
jgi:diguanylate cyclase (GGDEF)-like protein/PAS domain S-box-containing protein